MMRATPESPRMFQSDQIESQGPLTINEWMSQARIKP